MKKVIALPEPMPLDGETVAVVLSSPKILTRNYGAEIDGHDEVFRFHAFEIVGYEQHCGVKTTVWVCYDYSKSWLLPEFHAAIDLNSMQLKACKKFTTPHFFGAPRTKELAGGYYLAKEHFDEMAKLFGHASSGVRILYALIQSGVKPDLYGFEPFESETYKHYYSAITYTQDVTKHGLGKEKAWIIEQARLGNLVIK